MGDNFVCDFFKDEKIDWYEKIIIEWDEEGIDGIFGGFMDELMNLMYFFRV